MLDTVKNPQDVNAELQKFRESLRQNVVALAAEMTLRNKMNARKVEALCAQIDMSVREYSTILLRNNTARVAEEAAAATQSDVLDIRRAWGVVSARTNLFRVELNQWNMMRDLVRAQVMQSRRRVPLYDSRPSEITRSQISASDDVFDWVHAILNTVKQTEEAREQGGFPDIALPNSEFHRHLHAAYRLLLAKGQTARMRFLDVGCGGGLKVLSALRYFKEADGLDFQQSYVDIAQALLEGAGATASNAFHADALTFDGYGDYDVIYFYRPIRDQEKIIEMERQIVDQVSEGTILVAPYVGFGARHADLGCGRVAGHVYMAKTSQKEADRWRRMAEQTGVAVVHSEEERVPTIWTPLLEASRQSGYDVERYVQPV